MEFSHVQRCPVFQHCSTFILKQLHSFLLHEYLSFKIHLGVYALMKFSCIRRVGREYFTQFASLRSLPLTTLSIAHSPSQHWIMMGSEKVYLPRGTMARLYTVHYIYYLAITEWFDVNIPHESQLFQGSRVPHRALEIS